MTVCPVCDADSDLTWRCDECGKPFHTSQKAGRDQVMGR